MDGGRVAYETRGAGPGSVVLVHGGAHDRSAWRWQLDGLRVGRRLVAMDLLGHGASDKPELPYTMDLYARSVAAVLDHLGIGRAVLVGHSNGVPTIRQFYRLFPARVEALVAVDGALRQTMPRPTAEWMLATLRRPDYEQFIRQMADRTPAGAVPPADLERIKAGVIGTPRHVMVSTLEALLDPRVWQEDPIKVPLLAVLAAGQPHWTPEYESFVRGLAPGAEYHLWENVSHFIMLERPDDFNRLLEDFVFRLRA